MRLPSFAYCTPPHALNESTQTSLQDNIDDDWWEGPTTACTRKRSADDLVEVDSDVPSINGTDEQGANERDANGPDCVFIDAAASELRKSKKKAKLKQKKEGRKQWVNPVGDDSSTLC